MPGRLPIVVQAVKGNITAFVDEDLMEPILAPELAREAEKVIQHHEWRDEPGHPVIDVRIHRVRDVGMSSDLLYVDINGRTADLLVERSLMRPTLPDLLAAASMEVGRNFA